MVTMSSKSLKETQSLRGFSSIAKTPDRRSRRPVHHLHPQLTKLWRRFFECSDTPGKVEIADQRLRMVSKPVLLTADALHVEPVQLDSLGAPQHSEIQCLKATVPALVNSQRVQ
jgi:hypothetical protein